MFLLLAKIIYVKYLKNKKTLKQFYGFKIDEIKIVLELD